MYLLGTYLTVSLVEIYRLLTIRLQSQNQPFLLPLSLLFAQNVNISRRLDGRKWSHLVAKQIQRCKPCFKQSWLYNRNSNLYDR